jgi:hypothetical protein
MYVHQQGIEKFTSWYDRWFKCGCTYVEKQRDSNTIKFELTRDENEETKVYAM